MTEKKGPFRIFDSRKARDRYRNYKAVRSADLVVPPNHIACVSLIAPEAYLPYMSFTAIRIPTPETGEDTSCYLDCGTGKRYRRWRCHQDLGTRESPNGLPTVYTEYNSNVVYWGFDPFTRNVVEFEYIVRPGVYFLQADRCRNEVLDDCVNPTIIEASLIYTETVYDLLLPCSCRLDHWQNCEDECEEPTPTPTPDPQPTPDPEPEPYPEPDPEPYPEPDPEPYPEPDPDPNPYQ